MQYKLIYICKIFSLHYNLVSKAAGVSTSISVTKSSALSSALYSVAFNKLVIQFVPQTLITQTLEICNFSGAQKTFSLNYSQEFFASIEAY